ncbi:MAG: polysaccharide deacetylase family protein [Oscillospiraceae bacterium]|nr:polysaccharide deacetylase family protein [Oscillospiraceae bacterium]
MEEKNRMSSGKWLRMLLCTVLAISLFIGLFNYLIDPYGVFGDPILDWWSYNETLNPRAAKMAYLEKHHEEYDSYIVGASGSGSYPVEELNRYLDARFYNCFFYGADMADFEIMSRYLIEHYEVKNLLLNLSMQIATEYDIPQEDRTTYHYYKVDGSNGLIRSLQYLFNTPADSWDKLRRSWTDGYLQEAYKVFLPETGAYDKSRRDAEPIGDLQSYLAKDAYSVFADYPTGAASVPDLEQAMESVARVKALCEEKGVRLIVTCQPAYWEAHDDYSVEDQAQFRNALAQVTEYWDFTYSSVSFEPRYFYDKTHFRNSVGTMALARMFGNEAIYVPEDFGEFVPQGSQPGVPKGESVEEASMSCRVPILMYHHLVEDGGTVNSDTVQVSTFRSHMEALKTGGYEPVSFWDLEAYVKQGKPLPEKPVVITFDDGYSSNYDLAYPILQEYGFKATIFAIGVSMGKDTYKDTNEAMLPHFSVEEGKEMEASGLITVGSHGYNIHEVEGRDPAPLRKGVLQKAEESEESYIAFLREDYRTMEALIGESAKILAYPFGFSSELSEVVLAEMGVSITLTTQGKINTIIQGLPQSLRQLGRFRVIDDVSPEALIAMIGQPESRQNK